MIHELKTEQPIFDDVFYNRKEFEVRKNDRNFKIGDRLKLVEFPFSGRQKFVLKEIKYILKGGNFGLADDYVVLGLKEVPKSEPLSEYLKREKSMSFIGRGKL